MLACPIWTFDISLLRYRRRLTASATPPHAIRSTDCSLPLSTVCPYHWFPSHRTRGVTLSFAHGNCFKYHRRVRHTCAPPISQFILFRCVSTMVESMASFKSSSVFLTLPGVPLLCPLATKRSLTLPSHLCVLLQASQLLRSRWTLRILRKTFTHPTGGVLHFTGS